MLLAALVFIFFIGVLFGYLLMIYHEKRMIRRLIKTNNQNKLASDVVSSGAWADLVQHIQGVSNKASEQGAELIAQQNNMHRLISAAQESVIILNNKGRLMHYNSQSSHLFNIEGGKQVRYLNEIIRSPDVIRVFQKCVNSGQPITQECSFNIKNHYFHSSFKVTAVPFFSQSSVDKEGGYIKHQPLHSSDQVVLLFYDQTGVKESKRSHIDFVSNVSHELKTPLTAMQGFVEVLIHDLSQNKLDQFEKFLNSLLRNCKRIGHLVDDLLHLSNLSTQDRVDKEVLNTKEITHAVLDDYKYPDHKIHCFFSTAEVQANRRWVEIILRNLIDNACRHTPKGEGVHVRWEKEKDRILLKVSDDGEGVPEKYHQRIFERFFRMDSARSRLKGGAGVGLALVKQSMEKQGGCVRVVSAQNGGAEFICEFPT